MTEKTFCMFDNFEVTSDSAERIHLGVHGKKKEGRQVQRPLSHVVWMVAESPFKLEGRVPRWRGGGGEEGGEMGSEGILRMSISTYLLRMASGERSTSRLRLQGKTTEYIRRSMVPN